MGKLSETLALAQQRSRDAGLPYAGLLTPREAWDVLQAAPGARLVDVRTRAEWDWVGRVPGAGRARRSSLRSRPMDRAVSDAKSKLRTMKWFRAPGVVGYHTVRPLGGQPPYVRVLFRDPNILRICPDRIADVEIKRELVGGGE